MDETSVRREPIWGNKFVTNSSGPLSNDTWASKGILVIQDICLDTEGRLLSHTEVADRFDTKCTFLDMLSPKT